MRLLVFGQTGQVARELARRCPLDFDAIFLRREEADLSAPQICADIVLASNADIICNAAGWTAVDRAETEEVAAQIVNGDSPRAIALACADRGIPILHLSTDYVFDGSGILPFVPDHEPAPLGAYGRSKLMGEYAVRASGAHHLILRTSWVVSAHGSNFVKTMLRLGRERDTLRVVADQCGGPTPAADIADALFIAARAMAAGQAMGGIYHFAGSPDISWANFARAIMQVAGLKCQIEDIASADYRTPAQRPLNSRLDCTTFERDFSIARPEWRLGLEAIVKELGARA